MSKKINKKLAILTRTIVGVLALTLAIAIAAYLKQTRPQIEQTPANQILPQVQVIAVAKLPVHLQCSGYGTTTAMDQANIPSRVTSTVKFIPDKIDAGVAVQAGQLLVELDESDFIQQEQIAQQAIARIQANLKMLETEEKYLKEQKQLDQEDLVLSERDLKRVMSLFDRKAATPQDVDRSEQALLIRKRTLVTTSQKIAQIANRRVELQAQLASQKATLHRATLDVGRCKITSPIDGVLQAIDVELGENVTTGMRVGRVVSLNRIEVALHLPASSRSAVFVGDRVELTPVGSETGYWESTIARIAPEDDRSTRTLSVFVQLDQSDKTSKQLAPGRYIQGTVYSHIAQKHWLVPIRSVQADQLSIVRDGRVMTLHADVQHLLKLQFENIALDDENWAVLDAKLQAGDHIIIQPSRLMSDGKKVESIVVVDQTKINMATKKTSVEKQKPFFNTKTTSGPRNATPTSLTTGTTSGGWNENPKPLFNTGITFGGGGL